MAKKSKNKAKPKSEPKVQEPVITAEELGEADQMADSPNHITINKANNEDALWYVAHTYSGQENQVAQNLKQRVESMGLDDKIYEILIPTAKKIEVRGGAKHEVSEKIFPGYLMVRLILTDQSWLVVRTTPGVTGFVGAGNKPTPLDAKQVEGIMKYIAQDAPKFKTKFSVGEAVKITDGPFADFLGTVESIDDAQGKVKVLVSIFGRETPVELDFLQVAKI